MSESAEVKAEVLKCQSQPNLPVCAVASARVLLSSDKLALDDNTKFEGMRWPLASGMNTLGILGQSKAKRLARNAQQELYRTRLRVSNHRCEQAILEVAVSRL